MTSLLAFDCFVCVQPVFGSRGPEFGPSFTNTAPIKRLDLVGAPSVGGSCFSELLADVWRFRVPSNQSLGFSFFYPAEGGLFRAYGWVTDLNGVPIGLQPGVSATICTAVGDRAATSNGVSP